MTLSKLFRTTALAAAFALGLSHTASATSSAEQLQQATAAYFQQDYASAFKLFLPLAKQGNPDAQFRIGELYLKGKGIAEDHKQAFYWLQKAAKQNVRTAKAMLGVLYYSGKGVKQDEKKGLKLIKEACKQGSQAACNALEELK